MENQATNKIICRKCGGPHFTIKCGIEKKEVIVEIEKSEYKYKSNNNQDYKNNFEKKERKQYFKTTYRVKISDLPVDMTEEEMMELTSEWGHIVRLKVLNYNESSVAYVDFGYEDEANYFIKAIDKTPFEMILICAIRVDSYNPT
jgi:RNA recognition motif-containing protein